MSRRSVVAARRDEDVAKARRAQVESIKREAVRALTELSAEDRADVLAPFAPAKRKPGR